VLRLWKRVFLDRCQMPGFEKKFGVLADGFFQPERCSAQSCPTMRAADGGESARFTGIFLALGFSCSQTLFSARPLSAANASRWVATELWQGK
jgi:hypothetical protein